MAILWPIGVATISFRSLGRLGGTMICIMVADICMYARPSDVLLSAAIAIAAHLPGIVLYSSTNAVRTTHSIMRGFVFVR